MLKSSNFLWLSSKYKLKGASHWAKSISVLCLYPALWTEERMFILESTLAVLQTPVSCFFYNVDFSTDYKKW